jgi:hypothetical protein
MNIGNFWFKNDEVVLLAGKPKEIVALAEKLEDLKEKNIHKFDIGELASQSINHPAKIYAMGNISYGAEKGIFYWPWLESVYFMETIINLRKIAKNETDCSFKLEKAQHPFL